MRHTRILFQLAILLAIIFCLLYLGSGMPAPRQVQIQAGGTTGGGQISLQTAITLVANYQESAAPGSKRGVYFGNGVLNLVTNQSGAAGVRIYFARQADGSLTLVLVGVDDEGHDLTGGPLIDTGFPCPPYCDTVSALPH